MARARPRVVGGTVQVSGLKELARDLGKVSPEIRKAIKAEIKDIAGIVANEAQRIATAKGLVDTGKLVRGIKPAISGTTGLVRDSTTRKGYPYPSVYEYGHGAARAFVSPAADAKQQAVQDAFGDLVDKALNRAGF